MKLHSKPIPFAGCFFKNTKAQEETPLVFIGLPDDSQSSYRSGCRKAPERIRFAYDGNCYNGTTESGVDLTERVFDLGDFLSEAHWDQTYKSLRKFTEDLIQRAKIPFFAGGDHAVTVPIVHAYCRYPGKIHVIQIDAHPDLYPEYMGNRFSHACTARRILEFGHILSLTQIGIRTMNPPQRREAQKYKDRLISLSLDQISHELPSLKHIAKNAPVYMTVDLDAFDPAFAPGVSHPVPGGLIPRQFFNFLHRNSWQIVGMDVVEVNPHCDKNDMTAILAAKILHEGMGHALQKAEQF